MHSGAMQFECETCGTMFQDRLFDISREYERVIFNRPSLPDEIEIADAENIANFCSSVCRELGKVAVMAVQRVPIPPVRPGIGPVESCSKCKGPVDMADWHLSFVEGELDTSGPAFRPLDIEYLAVVCRKCEPRTRAVGTHVEAQLQPSSS